MFPPGWLSRGTRPLGALVEKPLISLRELELDRNVYCHLYCQQLWQ
jgi:hypothetical protein